jgi:hypothetical protein
MNMTNVIDFNATESIKIRITELVNNIPPEARTNRSVIAALLVAIGDFIESIDCPNCRINATEEVVRAAADIHQCFEQASNGTGDHVH